MFARYAMPSRGALVFELAEAALLKDLEKTPAALKAALEGPRADEIFEPFWVCARME